MPPGKVAKPHIHAKSETIVFIVEGWVATIYDHGGALKTMYHGPGDFLFIPEGIIHLGVNLSTCNRAVFAEVRTEKQYNEDVVLQPEYTSRVEALAAELQAKFMAGTLDLPEGWRDSLSKPFPLPDL